METQIITHTFALAQTGGQEVLMPFRILNGAQISLNPYLNVTISKEYSGVVSGMRVNLNIELNLILIIIFSLSLSGCFGDYNPPIALGTHLKLMNMGPYVVELNLTDNNEYYIGDVITDKGSVRTGPPDHFTDSNYIKYSGDIMDKKDGKRKLSLNITHYEVITTSDDNLLEHGLSKWPWDGSNPYQTRYMGNYRWIIIKGAEDNEIDAACWIDDDTMFSLRMFDINESDSLAVLGSVTSSY